MTIKIYWASWDEPLFYQFGGLNLSAYQKLAYGEPFSQLLNFYNLSCYEPAQLIPGRSPVQIIGWLFSFEYIYGNGYAGRTGNIGRDYENDNWATSLCQVGRCLSETAPAGSTVGSH